MAPLSKFALLLAAAAPLALCEDGPAKKPTVSSVSYSGNGCPQQSNSVTRTGDWDDLGFKFGQLSADSPGTKSTVNCEAHVISAGASPYWQISVSDVTLRGRSSLSSGGSVKAFVQAYWSDAPEKTLVLEGETSSSGTVSIHASGAGAAWSKCIGADGNPGILNINVRVALSDGKNSFDVTSDDVNFKYRRCLI